MVGVHGHGMQIEDRREKRVIVIDDEGEDMNHRQGWKTDRLRCASVVR
jgi:hypothetical protein